MIKMFSRKSTWVMIVMVIALTAAVSVITHQLTPAAPEDSRVAYEQQIQASKQALESPYLPEYQKQELQKSIKINEYSLERDLPVKPSLWEQVQENSSLISILAIFISAAAATIVASEFSQGTIKLLLIRPLSRSRVLLSKYLAVMSFGLIMVITLFAVSMIVSGFLFGFDEASMLYKTMESYVLRSTALIIYPTLAFMLAVLFRTNTLAQGLTIVSIILGPQLASAFANYPWAKYLLFAHTDPSLILYGNPFGVSFSFSLAVLAVYFLGMIFLAWYTFSKRDIAA